MRGKNYNPGTRKVFTSGGYIALIAVIAVIAALVAITLLVVLPSAETQTESSATIVSINYPDEEIGVGSDLSKVYVSVTYSDGKEEKVALSSMVHEGLDVTKGGEQNVAVSYGGFESSLPITVKNVNCQMTYTASDGGSIIGGSNTESGRITQSVLSGGDADAVIAVPETGYKFVGWSDNYPYAKRRDTGVNESRDLIANFEKEKFTVVFFYNDGTTAKEQKVVYNEKPTDIPDGNDPKMSVYGYTFVGWSVDAVDYEHVTRDINIYPRYEKTATDVSVEISADKNGNAMGETDLNDYGYYAYSDTDKAKITATPFTGREFNGWYVLNSAGEYVSLGKENTEEQIVEIGDKNTKVAFRVDSADNTNESYSVSFLCNEKIANVSLKAEFAYSLSSVTFVNYQNSSSGNIECTIDDIANKQTIGDKIKQSTPLRPDGKTPVKIGDDTNTTPTNYGLVLPGDVYGMTFVGWYVQGDEKQTVIGKGKTFIEPTTLVAKWEKKEYTLQFVYVDDNGIEQEYGVRRVKYQNTIGSGGGIPVGTPEKDRYLFMGWKDALIGTLVDDTTAIIWNDNYGTGSDSLFLEKQTIRMIAVWTPITHKLTVTNEGGEGIVELIEKDNGQETTAVVSGEYTISEDKTYKVKLSAHRDSVIDSVIWSCGNTQQVFRDEELSAKEYVIVLQERYDNAIGISFRSKEYAVTVHNGNEVNKGYVTIGEERLFGETIETKINSGNTLAFTVTAASEQFALEKITISGFADGKEYRDEVKYDFSGSESNDEYVVTLEKIYSDVEIKIEYASKMYAVTVNNGENAITVGEYGGKAEDYKTPDLQTNYAYGTRIFYAITAPTGKYVSSVSFNGAPVDLYSASNGDNNVFFYDWVTESGDVSTVGTKRIDDVYYYSYGSAKLEEKTYFLCDAVYGGETVVFEQVNDEYEKVDSTTSSGVSGLTIKEYLESVLDVASKRISDIKVRKDKRITSLKCAFLPDKNTTVSVSFDDIEYDITVRENEYVSISYGEAKVSAGKTVTVTAVPVMGYRITGYAINGVEQEYTASPNVAENLVFSLEGIKEDKDVEIFCEPIQYNLVIVNANRSGAIYVAKDGDENGSKVVTDIFSYGLDYATGGRFVITVEDGKIIESVTVNEEAEKLVYNAEKYVYTDYCFSRDVIVSVTTADKKAVGTGKYALTFSDNDNASASVEYSDTDKYEVKFIAEAGYSLTKITVVGKKDAITKQIDVDFNDSQSFVVIEDNAGYVTLELASDEFDEGEEVEVTYVADPIRYTITASYNDDGGTVTTDGIIYHGKQTKVIVNAGLNRYISSFKVNDEEVPFVNEAWASKTMSSYSGKYTDGVYSFVASGNCKVEVKFALFTYRVLLDDDSVHGTTTLAAGTNKKENGVLRVDHDGDVTVSMKADAGYHIAGILVNGVREEGYVANNAQQATYVCKNVTSDISVYVIYEINRYSFRYSLVNGSANFASQADAANKLDCPDATKTGDNVYGGIAYGDNFSFVVTPDSSNGYYVYSITIKYSGYKGGERTRYYGDGFSADGGTVWFNKFLWDSALVTGGVTSDIELIEVVFKKKTFAVSFEQIGDQNGGTIAFSVINPLNTREGVIAYGGGDARKDISTYMFANGTIYVKQTDGTFASTSIALRYNDGKWAFADDNEQEYEMYFEYGLRCSVEVKPTEGYERKEFFVNDIDRNQNTYDNSYSFNIYSDTKIEVNYAILVFELSFEALVYNSDMRKILGRETLSYVSATLYAVGEDGALPVLAKLENSVDGTTFTVKEVPYGTKIKLEIKPKFSQYGVYLFNLQENNAQLPLTGDVTDTVTYGGDGKKTVEDMAYKATFKIKEYTIKAVTKYEEEINGETRNVFAADQTSAINWKSYWGTSADMKIAAGTGYYVNRVIIEYTDEKGQAKTVEINKDEYYSDETITREDGQYELNRNVTDNLYGKRDILTLPSVKSDYVVTTYFARNEYTLTYTIKDDDAKATKTQYIQTLKTTLNERNSVYPMVTNYEYEQTVHYYDEITGTITPKDGYKINGTKITVTYKVIGDDGNEQDATKTFELTKTGNGDEVTFTFHRASKAAADLFVSSDIAIEIDVSIKRYSLATTVKRENADGDTSTQKNNTEVKLAIKDFNGNNINVNGSEQNEATFTAAETPTEKQAEHHGSFTYKFTAPAGYYLSAFTVNGYTIDGLKAAGVIKDNTGYSCTVSSDINNGNRYEYVIELNVNTALINGSSDPWIKSKDINVSMSITPIQYKIRIIINGELKEFRSINGQSGATDGNTINVLSATSAYHFQATGITPSLFEGYEISNESTNVYFGTESDYKTYREDAKYKVGAALINNRTKITDYTRLNFTSSALTNSDVNTGRTVVYFEFDTQIKKYTQEIETTVYYSEENEVRVKALSEYGGAGTVVVKRKTGDVIKEYDLNEIEKYNETDVEYFSIISIEAKVNPGFVLYGIYEVVDGVSSKIISGTRNITYAINGNEHIVTIQIKNLSKEAATDRKFRLDFKQQSEITLTVANPYKYISSTRSYASYVNVEAYSSEYEMPSGKPSASAIIANTNVVSGEKVVETYRYTVYVGNYVKFIVTDKYQSATPAVRYYDHALSESASDPFADTGINELQESGYGKKVAAQSVNFYLYVGTRGRITTTKETIGAVANASGGTISYNDSAASTASSVSLSSDATVAGKTVTLKVTPDADYEFYRLSVRQPMKNESRKRGYIVFGSTDAQQWRTIAFDQIGDESANSSLAGDNYSRVVSSAQKTDATGKKYYEFKIWLCGDLELKVEFYRTYRLDLGIYLTDKVTQNGVSAITREGITLSEVKDVGFDDSIINGTDGDRVAYGASFTLGATKPEGDYQFVGWYVNGYNAFRYLEALLPDDAYLKGQSVSVVASEMDGLVKDGAEVSTITIYAVFQPIIEVMVYNEKYYAYEDHFNSWNLGTILASYYEFTRRSETGGGNGKIAAESNTVSVRDSVAGKTITEAKEYLKEASAYGYADAKGNKGGWSTLLSETDAVKGYDETMLANKIYTAYKEFTTLYQNVTNGDFLTNSWQNSDIVLNATGMTTTAQFNAWQYYNWNTNTWQNIAYRYKDPFIITSTGAATTVDCYFTSYALNLSALYTIDATTETAIMPYAVSAKNTNNINATKDEARPLLIRPDFYQTIVVSLSQVLYETDLSNEDPEQTAMSESLVVGKISNGAQDITEPVSGRGVLADSGKEGTFEYGTAIKLVNNSLAPGKDVVSEDQTIRYRFLGWFLKYEDTLYYLKNSEADDNGAVKDSYGIMLSCISNTAETTMSLIAIYVAQYKQSVFSYNISGSESESYGTGNGSYDAAPTLTLSAENTAAKISFNSFDLNGTKKIDYEKSAVDKYFRINKLDGSDVSWKANQEQTAYSEDGKTFEYYIDAGLEFTITIKENDGSYLTDAAQMKANKIGFYPETDTLYKYVKNDETLLADYSTYYNTGKAIYYGPTFDSTGSPTGSENRAYTAKDMTSNALKKVGTVTNDKTDSARSNQYDVMYVSTATLIFYNLTYKGGVTVPSSLASVISGGKTSTLTVWDENTQYGDYNEITSGTPKSLGANGEVVIRVTLNKVLNEGYKGRYKFAFAGMQNGEGFETAVDVVGPGGQGLFSSSKDPQTSGKRTFSRWLEVDLSEMTTTRLFGDATSDAAINDKKVGDHTSTPSVYTTANAGDPKNGYNVKTVAQLRYIESFWKNNAYSCVGITDPSKFELFDDKGDSARIWTDDAMSEYTDNYKNYYGRTKFVLTKEDGMYALLTGLSTNKNSNPASGVTNPWVPLCNGGNWISSNTRYVWGTNRMPERNSGFDGILEGNGATITGMVTESIDVTNYGLFAIISGGTVQNLVIDNAYIKAASGEHTGLLAGTIDYSTITGITFAKKLNTAIYSGVSFKNTVSSGARIYIRNVTATNVGALAGRILNSKVSNITFNADEYAMEVVASNSAGLLAGSIEGEESLVEAITVQGNGWLFVGADYDVSTTYCGGLVGTVSKNAKLSSVTVESTVNMFIGTVGATASGGVVGFINGSGTLSGVSLRGSVAVDKADNFGYNSDPENGSISGEGIYILANPTGGYGSSVFTGSTGKAGGLVGYNNGGTVESGGGTVQGVMKIHAGAIGGIVGANAGRVTGFALKTGKSGNDYSGVTVLGWIGNDGTATQNYSVGGIVGANMHTSSGWKYEVTGSGGTYTVTRMYSGIVDDCSVEGTSTVTGAEQNAWNVGNVYAFLRTSSTDNTYKSISMSQATGNLTYTYRHNLMMGGIVGYNKGSVFNCFVNKTKLTFGVEHNATNKKSGTQPLSNAYSWGVEAGLIVGYHDPDGKASYGWGSAMQDLIEKFNNAGGSVMTTDVSSILKADLLRYRIQSCYSTNSVIAIVGRVWMDNASAWENDSGYGKESLKCAIGLGGIAGASAPNAYAEFAINTCYSNGNRLYCNINARGGTNRSRPYYESGEVPKNSGKWLSDNKTTWIAQCHPFYQIALFMGTYVGGINPDAEGNVSTYQIKGDAIGYYYNDGGDSKGQADYYKYKSDKWDFVYADTTAERWVRYTNSDQNDSPSSSLPTDGSGNACEANLKNYNDDNRTMQNAAPGTLINPKEDDDKVRLGSIEGKVVATDLTTGLLKYSYYLGTMKIGDEITKEGLAIAAKFSVNGTNWTYYSSNLVDDGITPNPGTYCVRGQN